VEGGCEDGWDVAQKVFFSSSNTSLTMCEKAPNMNAACRMIVHVFIELLCSWQQ